MQYIHTTELDYYIEISLQWAVLAVAFVMLFPLPKGLFSGKAKRITRLTDFTEHQEAIEPELQEK